MTGLFVALAILTVGCEYSQIDGIGTRTADEVFPPQHDLTSFDGCTPGQLGQWRFSSRVTNNSPKVAAYEITVAFYDEDVRLDEFSSWIRDLKPGETAVADTGRWIDGSERVSPDVSCSPSTVGAEVVTANGRPPSSRRPFALHQAVGEHVQV